jgi:hypothetical protein
MSNIGVKSVTYGLGIILGVALLSFDVRFLLTIFVGIKWSASGNLTTEFLIFLENVRQVAVDCREGPALVG